jgi:hypothetical protein
MELTRPKELAEQRLFQAILVQALEDVLNPSILKKKRIGKKMHINGFLIILKIFRMCVGQQIWIQN